MTESEIATTAREVPRPRLPLGARVRVADAGTLRAALRRRDGGPRPEPAQMRWAGREASVVGYRVMPTGEERYVLSGAPGLWCDDWLAAL